MKKNLLVTISLVSILALPGAQLFAQVSKSSTHPVTTPAMSEAQSIEHVLKALFEKPEAPLKVSPVSIEGEYAVAGWLQDPRWPPQTAPLMATQTAPGRTAKLSTLWPG